MDAVLPAPSSAPPVTHVQLPAQFDEHEAVPWTGLSILIVVAGLILFMAVPWRPPTAKQVHHLQTSLRAELALEELELAVHEYRHDHGEWPGARPAEAGTLAAPIFEATWFTRQLGMASNSKGEVIPSSAPEYPLGPYLTGELPLNPRTGLRTLRILAEGEAFEAVRDGIYGWLYNPRTGEIRAHQLPSVRTHESHTIR